MQEKGSWETGKLIITDLGEWQRHGRVLELSVSPDGQKVAAPILTEGGTMLVCENGVPWEGELEKAWGLRYLPDGRLLAIVRRDDAWTLGTGGTYWENTFAFAWNPKWSADGSVVAVQVKREVAHTLCVNDSPWSEEFRSMRDFCLGPDGLAAGTVQVEELPEADIFKFMEGTWSVAVAGARWPQTFINTYAPVFSQDGKHVAAEVRLDICEYTVAVDGKPWEQRFSMIWEPCFKADGTVLVPVRHQGSWTVAQDGQPIWSGGYMQLWRLSLSPDQSRLAAVVAPSYGRFTVAVDDRPWPVTFSDAVLPPCFSPDGQRVAAIVRDQDRFSIAVDGKPWDLRFDMVYDPVFSPDSSRLAAKVESDGRFGYALDGRVGSRRFEACFDPVFGEGGKVLLRYLEGSKLCREVVPVDSLLS